MSNPAAEEAISEIIAKCKFADWLYINTGKSIRDHRGFELREKFLRGQLCIIDNTNPKRSLLGANRGNGTETYYFAEIKR